VTPSGGDSGPGKQAKRRFRRSLDGVVGLRIPEVSAGFA